MHVVLAELPGPDRVEVEIDRRQRVDRQAVHGSNLGRPLVQEEVGTVQSDWHTEFRFRPTHAGDVIDVSVRQQDVFDREAVLDRQVNELIDLITWIDDDALAARLAAQHITVLVEGRNGPRLDDHKLYPTAPRGGPQLQSTR